MKKPLIGITCRYNEETLESSLIPTYMDSVSELGAIPILLYCTNDETLLKGIAKETVISASSLERLQTVT